MTTPTRLARALLWDFERGTWPYMFVCLVLLILMLVVQPAWLGDPTAVAFRR